MYDENNINESINSEKNKDFYCLQHPDQKYTHYIEFSKEKLCIYCAFERYKLNPNLPIKDIKEKANEILTDLNKIIEEDNMSVDIIQQSVNDMKNNLKVEEEKVNNFFSNFAKIIEEKRQEHIENIRKYYISNKEKIGLKLNFFGNKMESTDNLKNYLTEIVNSKNIEIFAGIENFSELVRVHSDQKNSFCELAEYKFLHDDINNLNNFVGNFSEIKSKNKIVNFGKSTYDPNNNKINTNNVNNMIINSNNKNLFQVSDENKFNFNSIISPKGINKGISSGTNNENPNKKSYDIVNSSHFLKEGLKNYDMGFDSYEYDLNSPKPLIELDLNKYKKSSRVNAKGFSSYNSEEILGKKLPVTF